VVLTSAASSSESEYGTSTLQRMNHDWESLSRDPRAADHVTSWAAEHPVFAGARVPQDVADRLVELYRLSDWHGHDQALAALFSRATTNDYDGQLAWRVAVRVLMPRAIRVAKTQLRNRDWDEVISTMLSALFEVVRTYPLHRRPRLLFVTAIRETLKLARRTLAADLDGRTEVRWIARNTAQSAGNRSLALDPSTHLALAELLARAAELQLVGSDETELVPDDARTELLALITWAVDIRALTVSDARRIRDYYLVRSDSTAPAHRTTRAMGAEGARLRQRASRAVRPLRRLDLNAYHDAA
jgi:hypothetical protein